MSKRSLGLLTLLVAGLFVFSACADPQQPTATSVIFEPTASNGPPATSTPSGTQATPRPTATTPSGPDASAGQATFDQNCSLCHNTTDVRLVGPGLAGVAERAATRVEGMSADDYLRTSIKNPGEFIVPDFPNGMPNLGLSDSDIENVVAYLKTLQ